MRGVILSGPAALKGLRLSNFLQNLELLLNKLFLHLALAHIISNPVIQSMKLLKQNNKSNLLNKFALALCQTNPITGKPFLSNDVIWFGRVPNTSP